MSKKLLNESTIRRFAGLAGIGADVVSNFINEAYDDDDKMEEEIFSEEEESEEVDMEMDAGDEEADMDMDAGDEEAEMDMDMDAGAEGGDDAEALVSDIVAQLQRLAAMAGVDIDVEMEDEAEELDEMGMNSYGRDDDLKEEKEETLEEIINGILAEEEEEIEEMKYERDEDSIQEQEEEDDPEPPFIRDGTLWFMWKARQDEKERQYRKKKNMEKGEVEESFYASPVHHKRDDRGKMKEEVVQEVLRRVRARLAKKTKQ